MARFRTATSNDNTYLQLVTSYRNEKGQPATRVLASLGNITKILTTVSNDIYMVNGSDGEILIPAIDDVVKSVDLDKGCMVIEVIEGLLNLNKKRTN